METKYPARVTALLRGATRAERRAIERELAAHVEDRTEALEAKGHSAAEALALAEAAMGDPAETAKALDAQFSLFWLWVKRLTRGAVACLLFLALISPNLRVGFWRMVTGVWDNLQARQGVGLELPEYQHSPYAQFFWLADQEMRVGSAVIRLTGVELVPFLAQPGSYQGHFYFCTYDESPFAPASEDLLTRLTIIPESGVMAEPEYNWGWLGHTGSRGVREQEYWGLVLEGDAYVDVTYDCFGTRSTMRCSLAWEVWP